MSTPVESFLNVPIEVLQPAAPPLIVSYYGTDNQTALVGQQQSEVDIAKDLDRESFIRHYPPLLFYSLNKQATITDKLYRETRSPVFLSAIPIPIFIQPNPPKRMLKRFGVETEQDAIGLVSAGWLERHVTSLQIKTGDRIGYYDQSYNATVPRPNGLSAATVVHEPSARVPNYSFEILSTKWTDYFTNTQIPLHKLLILKNLRAPGIPDTNIGSR